MEYGILAPCKVKSLEEPPAEAKILFLHIFALIPVICGLHTWYLNALDCGGMHHNYQNVSAAEKAVSLRIIALRFPQETFCIHHTWSLNVLHISVMHHGRNTRVCLQERKRCFDTSLFCISLETQFSYTIHDFWTYCIVASCTMGNISENACRDRIWVVAQHRCSVSLSGYAAYALLQCICNRIFRSEISTPQFL
jgi:hypothetical protein